MFIEAYSKFSTYLLDTFGANVMYFIVVVTTLLSIIYLIVISYVITKVDKRYFIHKNLTNTKYTCLERDKGYTKTPYSITINSEVNLLMQTAKILSGALLVIVGLALLVLPGQGIITILIGLSLLPFPGKHKLEQKLLSRQSVQSTLNWIRIKAKKEPFIFE